MRHAVLRPLLLPVPCMLARTVPCADKQKSKTQPKLMIKLATESLVFDFDSLADRDMLLSEVRRALGHYAGAPAASGRGPSRAVISRQPAQAAVLLTICMRCFWAQHF